MRDEGLLLVRYRVFSVAIAFLTLVLMSRLFWLQIVEGNLFSERSRSTINKIEEISTVRGRIFDRSGKLLATNEKRFDLLWTPTQGSKPLEELRSFAQITNSSFGHYESLIASATTQNRNQPIPLLANLSLPSLIPVAEERASFPNIRWDSYDIRQYKTINSFSHILGYLGEIDNRELELLYNEGYALRSNIGKNGLEREYDSYLRGKNGLRYQRIDVSGQVISGEENADIIEPPSKGFDLITTIDSNIQVLTEKALGDRNGSIVVLKPTTGEILALVSYPTYDANLFSSLDDPKNREKLNLLYNDSSSPFLNRAFQAVYPPASTFKLVLATIILQEGVVSEDYTVFCPGYYEIGDRKLNCHKLTGHGSLSLKDAFAQSCNVYFAKIGYEKIGVDKIIEYARGYGLGTLSGIDLPSELSGTLPTPNWKEERFQRPWTGGDTANMAIGQGFLTTSILQMADLVASILNDGKIYKPHLVKEITSFDTQEIIEEKKPELIFESSLSPEVYERLRELMRYTTLTGTVAPVNQSRTIKYAGKTGTGETGVEGQLLSWFVSFAPYDAPPEEQIVIVSMVEPKEGESYEYWGPKAIDIIYGGIYGGTNYEETIKELRRRGVWYVPPDA